MSQSLVDCPSNEPLIQSIGGDEEETSMKYTEQKLRKTIKHKQGEASPEKSAPKKSKPEVKELQCATQELWSDSNSGVINEVNPVDTQTLWGSSSVEETLAKLPLTRADSQLSLVSSVEESMAETMSEMGDSIAGDITDESVPAYTNGLGEVLVPVKTSLGIHYRTMRKDSSIDKIRSQMHVEVISQEEFARRKSIVKKKSRKK